MTNTRTVMGRTVTITDENIIDAMPASACNYWGDVRYKPEGLDIIEDEDGICLFVTYDQMRDAFVDCVHNVTVDGASYVVDYIHGYFLAAITNGDDEDGGVDWGCIDTDAMDVWVQRAAFGKLVYG